MSLVIMVHTEMACKEYFLPAMNNADYSLLLEKEQFQLGKDMRVFLEVIKNQWSFVSCEDYSLVDINGQSYFEKKLKDGDLIGLDNEYGHISFLIVETDQLFQIFNKYDIGNMNEIIIGADKNSHISYGLFNYVSGVHALLQNYSGCWSIQDCSKNGTFVNEKRVQGSCQLQFGDCITIFGLRIVFLDNVVAINRNYGRWPVIVTNLSQYFFENYHTIHENILKLQKQYFKRSPRNVEHLYTDKIEIEAPPTVHQIKKKPLFMTIGPSFTMAIPMLLGSGMAILSSSMRGGSSGLYMFTGLITAFSSAAVGIFWALSNLKYEKNVEKDEQEQRYNSYGAYLQNQALFIKEKYKYNTDVLNHMYISGVECCQYGEDNPALWNRNFSHEDFLSVRLGIGTMDFQAEIVTPKQKFSMETDDLGQKPEILKNNYQKLYQVPICLNLLDKRLIGIAGGMDKVGAMSVLRNIVAQIAVNNCYTDVKMVFIYHAKSPKEESMWAFSKWLPHVWADDKKTRFVASNKNEVGDVCYELAKILRTRTEELRLGQKSIVVKPHYVLFIEDFELLSGELLAKYILEPKPEYGLTTMLLEDKYENLPNACEDIIQNDGKCSCFYNVTESSQNKKDIIFDVVETNALELLARRLSNIEVNASAGSGEIVNTLDFFEMYGVSGLEELHVLDRWTKNRTSDSMKVLIGKKSGQADCYLDIHEKYHGPHGLVAGTTGSGKSETLQTYMLSLAVNFSPYDVGFFIIDFKGGGMANLFSNLPHLIGKISNLSGNQVRRAMISIKSENKRRQRIFTENSVNNINLYTRLYKNGEAAIPIPHLFIIIDEFAELKREEPEFMKELISVAQVGRSLGVHLILATQKPSGTVDDNIWSNTKFRLCLRVQDRQDSNDMLHKPDAAYITQAGRGYLQVGNDEIYELFQSGYSGGVYEPDSSGKASIATMLTLTGKAAIVGNKTKKKRAEKQKREWLCSLSHIILSVLEKMNVSVNQIIGEEQIFHEFITTLMLQLHNQGFEFEESSYNVSRIREYLDFCTRDMSNVELFVDQILLEAQQKNRKLPELKEKTQLDAVVEYLGILAKQNGYEQNLSLWLPVLPTMLSLKKLKGFSQLEFKDGKWSKLSKKWTLDAMIGLYDDPENQQQQPLVVDFANDGHHAVCGTVVTGKSTFLQSLIYSFIVKYPPEYINLYILDYSSRMLSVFEEDKHIGGIIYDTDVEKTARFFNMLETIMDERKSLFKGGNYSQYVQANGISLPSIVIVIDNFANFKEKTENQYETILIRISREGVGYGIFLLIASAGFGTAEIQSRIGDNIRTVIALELGDKFKMAEVLRTTHVETMPETDVKGRGLAYVDGRILEFQTAVALETIDDYERGKFICKQCMKMSEAWQGARARKIPEIPSKPIFFEFCKMEEYIQLIQTGRYLPVGYYLSDASLYGLDLRHTYSYIISGKARSGKTNLLKALIHAASRLAADIAIIEYKGSELKKLAERIEAQYITEDQQAFQYFDESVSIFRERNHLKRSLLEDGVEEDEIYEKMRQKKPIFIFIADLTAFVQSVYRRMKDGATMNGYLENITEKGFLHNIYFISCLNTETVQKVSGFKVYSNMVSYKTGIHLGGNINSQRIFNFTNIPFMEQGKSTKPGIGLTPSLEDNAIAQTIVLPFVKGI